MVVVLDPNSLRSRGHVPELRLYCSDCSPEWIIQLTARENRAECRLHVKSSLRHDLDIKQDWSAIITQRTALMTIALRT